MRVRCELLALATSMCGQGPWSSSVREHGREHKCDGELVAEATRRGAEVVGSRCLRPHNGAEVVGSRCLRPQQCEPLGFFVRVFLRREQCEPLLFFVQAGPRKKTFFLIFYRLNGIIGQICFHLPRYTGHEHVCALLQLCNLRVPSPPSHGHGMLRAR